MNSAPAQVLAMASLRIYKRIVSPWLPPACRFVPSCSDYALEAIGRYGFAKGCRKALARLLRCHPFHRGGYDPLN
jgi:putative membrane protein insertion efficiency factor